jgi:RNA polymerase primary sigma factor
MTRRHDPAHAFDPVAWWTAEVGREPLLSPDEERELARAARAGDGAARDRLIRANLRLARKVARHYRHRGMDLDDLMGSAVVGLVRGIDRYDPDRGVKVATYVSYWIRQAVLRAFVNVPPVRIPQDVYDRVDNYMRTGHVPVCKVPQYRDYLEAAAAIKRSRVERAGGSIPQPVPAAADPEATAALRRAVAALPPRLAAVVRLRYGLHGGPPLRQAQVAARLGLQKSRVGQLEELALRLLRCDLADLDVA